MQCESVSIVNMLRHSKTWRRLLSSEFHFRIRLASKHGQARILLTGLHSFTHSSRKRGSAWEKRRGFLRVLIINWYRRFGRSVHHDWSNLSDSKHSGAKLKSTLLEKCFHIVFHASVVYIFPSLIVESVGEVKQESHSLDVTGHNCLYTWMEP